MRSTDQPILNVRVEANVGWRHLRRLIYPILTPQDISLFKEHDLCRWKPWRWMMVEVLQDEDVSWIFEAAKNVPLAHFKRVVPQAQIFQHGSSSTSEILHAPLLVKISDLD